MPFTSISAGWIFTLMGLLDDGRPLNQGKSPKKKGAGFVPVIPATVQPTGLTLSLPNGLEIRGIEANNLGLVRDLLGMLA